MSQLICSNLFCVTRGVMMLICMIYIISTLSLTVNLYLYDLYDIYNIYSVTHCQSISQLILGLTAHVTNVYCIMKYYQYLISNYLGLH